MKKLLLFICMFLTINVFAENIPVHSITIYRLHSVISKKYNAVKIDIGNETCIKITNAGLVMFCGWDEERKMIRFFAIFENEKLYRSTLIERANKFNYNRIFLRVCVDDDNDAICDYRICCNGGINTTNLMESIDWFLTIAKTWQTEMYE